VNGNTVIAVAGPSGDLGFRIAQALAGRRARVRALVRPDVFPTVRARLGAAGLELAEADPRDLAAMTAACAGAACVVSALNGLHDVIVERQGVLLDAAVRAGVPRFIPSDYSADFTRTRPGDNRNFDLRRMFMARADRARIQVTSIFNGAFMDMLGAEMPIIQSAIRRVLYWGDADQLLDFTTKDDVAAYVAAAAMDATAPRILRVAGDSVSVRDIAATMTAVTGRRYRTQWAGSIGTLGVMIRLARIADRQPDEVFPPWQGMQYMRDMFSGRGKLAPVDNDRYPGVRWSSVRDLLAKRRASASA
jgi:nucleoside-diphosphate-sugar epimerase